MRHADAARALQYNLADGGAAMAQPQIVLIIDRSRILSQNPTAGPDHAPDHALTCEQAPKQNNAVTGEFQSCAVYY
jgi:hypothetical protein